MAEPFVLTSNDPILQTLPFKPYRNAQLRHAEQFSPAPNEPQELLLHTPWGEELVCKPGDYIVCELNNPNDRWPVEHSIFQETYQKMRSGLYTKKPVNKLVPLIALTHDPERIVEVHTLEGVVEVRAGDFFLACGPRGEIWPIPKAKVEQSMILDDASEE